MSVDRLEFICYGGISKNHVYKLHDDSLRPNHAIKDDQ